MNKFEHWLRLGLVPVEGSVIDMSVTYVYDQTAEPILSLPEVLVLYLVLLLVLLVPTCSSMLSKASDVF
jgi:hypothetical protein